jgi:hypothetical protein
MSRKLSAVVPPTSAGNADVGLSLPRLTSDVSFTYDHQVAMRRLATSTTSITTTLSDAATTNSKIMTALLVDVGANMAEPWRFVIPIENKNCAGTG